MLTSSFVRFRVFTLSLPFVSIVPLLALSQGIHIDARFKVQAPANYELCFWNDERCPMTFATALDKCLLDLLDDKDEGKFSVCMSFVDRQHGFVGCLLGVC